MKIAKTEAAKAALKDLLDDDAQAAAGGNALISRREGQRLDPANRRAELALRAEGGPGTRVTAGQVAARAYSDAVEVWDAVNVRGPGALSKAEVAAIGAADPALASVTQDAYLSARGLLGGAAAVRSFFETFDFGRLDALPQSRRVDVRPGQPARADVPASVLSAFDHYFRAEAMDWATVRLMEARVAGQAVYALHMRTDGDDGYLEVFKKDGTPLTSARLFAEQLLAHDEYFGRCRMSPSLLYLDDPRFDEGLSEAPERAAAGQVPLDWRGDVVITGGEVTHEGRQLGTVTLAPDVAVTPEQQKVLFAAMELLWERTLQHRVFDDAPIALGRRGAGELRIGEFTRPDDGKTYLAADWRDVDDDSFVFYFTRDGENLRYAIQQYDN
ncbi:MAG: hypothetical protein KC933_24985 [Myxococcales bacterium]|nr:hypothetical protein [Myxococcales bacterium]